MSSARPRLHPICASGATRDLLLAVAYVTAAGAQQDLGFESTEAEASWEVVGADGPSAASVVVDDSTALVGSRSLKIEQSGAEDFVRVARRVPAPAPARDGVARRVRVSAAVRDVGSPRAGPTVWLRVSSPRGAMFVDSRGDARDTASAASGAPVAAQARERQSLVWVRHELELPLPDDAQEIVLGAALLGGGTAWFDDFRIDVIATDSWPAPSGAAVRYVDAALELIRAHALNAATVDWTQLRGAVLQHARGAVVAADTYPALRYALLALGDRHSYLLAPEAAAALSEEPVANALTGRALVEPQGAAIGERFAYLAVPSFAGGTAADQVRFAASVQAEIEKLDSSDTCGWILDLRTNTGGNLWPMLAGAGPLLGEGELGASVYPDGIRRPFWYRDGQAGFGEYVQLRVVAPHRLRDAAAPLAVLLGPRTASSAEVLAAAARGRPHARSFGAPTRGVSAGNRTFELSDHAAVVLTVAATADRTGRADLGPLEPDERVAASYRGESVAASDRAAVERAHDGAPTEASRPRIGAESGAPADPVVAVATAWLATQDTCR